MTIAALRCPACGANVECFDAGVAQGWCPYCGSRLVDIAALQASYAVSAEHEDLLRTARGHIRMGNLADAARYARRYIDVCPAAFDGYLALMDALPAPSEGDLYGWERVMPELSRACVKLRVCVGNTVQRQLAEKRRQQLLESSRAVLGVAEDALEAAHTVADAAQEHAREAGQRADELHTEYLGFQTGDYMSRDFTDEGLAGFVNTIIRDRHNAQVSAQHEQKQQLFEKWQAANADHERLKRERREAEDDVELFSRLARTFRPCVERLEASGDEDEDLLREQY